MHVIVLVSVIASLSLCSARGPPLILEVSPMNAPTVGGKIITIYGENFGDKSEGLSIDIRGFPCPEVVLQSPTRALCEVPPGLGTGHEFILTTMDGTQVVKSTSAPAAKFSYDAPYVNIVMPGNGPTTGGTQITVSGKNFGMAINHPNPEVTIGGKNCLQSIWEHDGKVKCVSPSGIGIGNVVVYLQGQQSQAGYDTIYEYDEPVVTGVNPDHGPTGGGSKITVLGKNFGVQDSRPTVSVGHTPCTLTVWQSDSSIVCTVPSGQGHDHLLEATIIGAHSKENALVRFSFDSPVVSAVSPANIPPTDAIALTLYGEAFGGPDAILNAFIGPTKCLKTSWTSSTTLSCTTPAGTGGARSIILVAGDTTYPVASAAEMAEGHVARVSYDAPIITAIVPATGATSGSEELTLWGRNFGGKPQNVRVSVGGTACLNANWQSDAEVTCRLSPGTGNSNVVLLTVDGQSSPSRIAAADGSTYEPIVVFQPPSLSSISPSVGKPQGGVLITVEGANFGTDKAKVQVLFGKHAGKVLRAEETNLLVLAPAGEGEDEVKVTVDGQASKLSGLAENVLFRYDGPSITSLSVDHGPTVGGTVIDISGSNLGANGLQLSIAVGGIPCISVQWISSTSSQCTSPPGVGGSHIIEMSIDGAARANSGAFRFSYDRPIIESVEPSLFSECGGDRIAILGRNFGEVEGRASQMIVQVGRTQCAQTSWVSDAELDCTTPPGPLGDAAVTVRISGQASSAFTIERTKPGAAPPPPHRPPPPPATPAPPAAGIIGIKPDHASPSGGDLISIFGTGFNSRDGEPEVAFGRFGCYQSQTVSATELVCRLPSGVGAALRPSVSYPGQPIILGPENLRFSYNAPIVTSVTPSKGSVLGGDMITMTGSNFGDGLSNIEGYVGDNQCLESSYVSASEITCLTPHGSSQPQPLFVQAGGQRGSASRATFLFLGRMIDSVSPDHMRTSGGSRVVIKSSSFTKADYTEVLIGGKRCNGTQWQSLNAVSCIVPAGVGGNLDVSVMLGSDVWNGFGSFSYDAATVQRIDPSEGPSAGNIPISVFGRNFGETDADPVVYIGRSACTSTFYFSDSVAMCVLPPGGGRSLAVTVSIGGQHVLASAATFDYESPMVSSVTPSIGPSYGGSVLTVTGSGFGSSADGATVFVGNEPCEASSWISDTQMLCVSPRIDLVTGSSSEDVDSSDVDGLAVTVRVFNQSSRSSATFVSSAEDVSPTEFNPGFGHPPNRKRGPFYVSVAYILAIALAAAVLLLGRHLMRRPAPSSLLSSYTGVSLEESETGFPLRAPSEWSSQVSDTDPSVRNSNLAHTVRQPEEGAGLLHSAWSSAKAFAGRAFGRSQPSGYGGGAAFSAADMDLDDEQDAAQPMLGRANRQF